VDVEENCKSQKDLGLCAILPEEMKIVCNKTCNFCGDGPTDSPITDYSTSTEDDSCSGYAPTVAPTLPTTKRPTPSSVACGRPQINEQRVVAGRRAKEGRWPWQVLLLFSGEGGCGGSIVGPRHVVTAAHCVEKKEERCRLSVRVGELNRRETSGHEVEHRVTTVYSHPDYNVPSYVNNDIAVLELEKPIQFNKYVQPVCLPQNDPPVGTKCFVTGWGKTKHPGNMIRFLQQAKMPVVDHDVCNKKNKGGIGVKVTDHMLCAGDGGRTRKSACHGDSGGPFVCNNNGRWELQGVTSHGSGRCASKDAFSVFARVARFKSWIESIMNM